MNGTTGARAEDTKEVGEGVQKWEGISEIILGHKEWFDAWMEGERACELSCVRFNYTRRNQPILAVAMDQYMEIISGPDAWQIAEDTSEEDEETVVDRELKPTNSARQVKPWVEKVPGKYGFR